MITPKLTENIVYDLVISTEDFPVNFDLAWRWLEFTRKENAKRSLINCQFIEGIDFRVFHPNQQNSNTEVKTSIRGRKEGRRGEEIWLTSECFRSWAMMASTRKGQEVRKYYLECEKKLKELTSQPSKPRISKQEYDRLERGEWSIYDLIERDLLPGAIKGLADIFRDQAEYEGIVAQHVGQPNAADVSKMLYFAYVYTYQIFEGSDDEEEGSIEEFVEIARQTCLYVDACLRRVDRAEIPKLPPSKKSLKRLTNQLP